ncbi:MAG: hypothetical protein M3458_21365 [Acidobacteriota bacterium]|nr:hypothetical protein [Acidobacteriota bacterium]
MSKTATLVLELVDVSGKNLREKVDISLRNQTLSGSIMYRGVSASKKIRITDLHGTPHGLYRVQIDPPAYLPVGSFVNLKASGETVLRLTFPIDPSKVTSVVFPKFAELPADGRQLLENSDQVFSFGGMKGEKLYDALDNVRKAGLMNIVAKARATPLSNGRTVLPYIQKLSEVRGDRFFAVVSRELREEIKNSVAEELFHQVDGSLHHPPAGFDHAGSFKTEDRYGNLQVTFFIDGERCVADVDIDDASGLQHIFQVLRNMLPGRSTHPYDIQQLLVYHQKLDPGYSVNV